jgi:murein DD-endopeptidase MepM/ murein hydrolase activator NlpD
MKKKYSIFIVPDGGSVRQFSIRHSTVIGVAAATLLMVAFFAVLSVNFFEYHIDRHRISSLEHENVFLTTMIETISFSIDSLRNEMDVITDKELAIRTIFDLPQIDPEQRQLGYGGPELLPTDELYTPTKMSAYQAEAEIERLLVQSNFETEQYADIYQSLIAKKEYLDHTPSILPTTGWQTCGYGLREDPFTGQKRLHAGIDIANRVGTPIVASAAGTVSYTGNRGRLGKTVEIDHGNGFKTIYGHCGEFNVKRGQKVKRGDRIALMGNSGYSTGPHLHYGILKDGRSVNPKKYIYSSDYLANRSS